MSAACSGVSTSACMNSVGGDTFSNTSLLLHGLMYAVAFLFIIFVTHECYKGLGEKMTYHTLFRTITAAIIRAMTVCLVVSAFINT